MSRVGLKIEIISKYLWTMDKTRVFDSKSTFFVTSWKHSGGGGQERLTTLQLPCDFNIKIYILIQIAIYRMLLQ